MKSSFRIGIYLVLATTIAMLVTLGGAYRLSVTEQVEQANAEAKRQRVFGKLEELVSIREAAESATLSYIIGPSERSLPRLRETEAKCRIYAAQLARLVADDAEQERRAAALGAEVKAMSELQRQVRMLREQQGAAAAVAFISSDAYRGGEGKVDRLVEAMRQREYNLDDARRNLVAERTRQLGQLTIWSGLLTIGLALFAAAVINRQREERRLTEAHLREQEKQYRLVTDSVPVMIGYVDSAQRMRFHNHAIEKWLDLPAERLDNHHLAEVLGSAAYASLLPEIELVLQGKRVDYERARRGIDGREHYLAGSFIPDFDSAGCTVGFFAMIIDITERKTAEEALRASEERWKFALEGAGDGVWDRNLRTDDVRYSKRHLEMLGFADGELENRRDDWKKRIHPQDRARVMAELQSYLDGNSPAYCTEYRIQCKDGGWKWILSRGVVVSRDAEGKPLRMIGTHADISARVRQHEEIIRANERLDLALQGSRLAIWDAAIADGKIYLSEGWAEMLGGAPRVTNTDYASVLEIVHPDDLERVRSLLLDALKGASPEYHCEHRVRTRAGKWKWILTHGRVVSRDAAGRALRMTGTNADISARKEIERMKNEFVSLVSHELRTPLSSIVGSLGLLARMTDLREDIQSLINVARDNSQRLVRLINDILDVEKLDSNTLQIQLEPVELEALLVTAIQANQGYADQYGVSLVLSERLGPAWVSADFDRLMQVMANLLSNAAKFSPRGASVEVYLERVGDSFRVSVADIGTGIPDEFKPRVFDRFAQADGSNSRSRGGTGLGLAICRMIVDKLGGKIDFVTTPGAGTTFYFDLPARATEPQQDEREHGAMQT
ncbi:MAG: PAS domain-containing protein [Burkholderiales bacterium]|nr:PAS domain-containing protein [Burkholderiales bacterium]